MSLGVVNITSALLRDIAEGVEEVIHLNFCETSSWSLSSLLFIKLLHQVGERPRIFIRRVFPVQNEIEVLS